MRILFISTGYHAHSSEHTEQLAAQVVRGLRQRTHTVQVLTTRRPSPLTPVENGVCDQLVRDIDATSRVPVPLQFFFQRRGREQHNVAYLQRVLSDFKPDVSLLWNLHGLQHRLIWVVEQTPDTPAVYRATGTSPVQPDEYSTFWKAALQSNTASLKKYLSRVALRQMRLENPGALRLDFVIEQPDQLEDEATLEQRLDEVEAVLNRARAHRRLGPPLPAARPQPLFDFRRGISRPIKDTDGWQARLDDERHLALAAQWLGVAQEMTGNGGLAQLFNTAKREWTPAYPETTGYAIPTLLHYAQLTHDAQLRERVRRMAQFLLGVQLANGAVPIVHADLFQVGQPCAFDVGQVIYGYLAAHREFKQPVYLEAAKRAGDWLIREQEPNGSWIRFTYHQVAHAWEIRASWALLLLAQASGERGYEQAARQNILWTRSQQRADGWFDHMALVPGEAAVMHTIAYTLEGMLECGLHLNELDLIQSARNPADLLLKQQRADGALPGAFVEGWRGLDHFTCLTGNAQMAIVWQRLYQLSGEEHYLAASDRLIDFTCRSQLVRTRNKDLRGGIPGSRPIDGDYLPHSLPNWSVKFFMDALLLRQTIRREGRAAMPPPR